MVGYVFDWVVVTVGGVEQYGGTVVRWYGGTVVRWYGTVRYSMDVVRRSVSMLVCVV